MKKAKITNKFKTNKAILKLETQGSASLSNEEWHLLHKARIKEQEEAYKQKLKELKQKPTPSPDR